MKIAYPHDTGMDFPFRQVDIKKWKDTRLKIKAAERVYIRYSQSQIVSAFIKERDDKEQQMFKRWFEQFDKPQLYNKYAGTTTMKKLSYEFVKDKVEALEQLKGKLRSRVRSVEALINQLLDRNLLGNGAEAQQKVTYLSRILQKLREEINVLNSPLLLEARQRLALRIFQQADVDEGMSILEDAIRMTMAYQKPSLVKVAQQARQDTKHTRLQDALDLVGTEISRLNYKSHLARLYKALQILDDLGRSADVDLVARVIRDDLPDLEKLNKRLTDVFVNLSRAKAELAI